MYTYSDVRSNKRGYLLLKRAFDILASCILLVLLSPLFLIVAVLIKIENPGPVFYAAPRVGRHYRVFPFFKFRSMRVNADKLLGGMKTHNHYGSTNTVVTATQTDILDMKNLVREDRRTTYNPALISNDGWVNESVWLSGQADEVQKTFVKFSNDPRITRIGHFIRNTSIDELPQLFNILRGDMSLVGNRPLPLYEAEKLTTDKDIERFFAPAGITGLWQVTERGKVATSADSRKQLDVTYARHYSLWLDLWILVKTPLALFQTENV
jgi:lipopolysaccharide/colanic/teichoic acid biosynthesis glycosyltransferase